MNSFKLQNYKFIKKEKFKFLPEKNLYVLLIYNFNNYTRLKLGNLIYIEPDCYSVGSYFIYKMCFCINSINTNAPIYFDEMKNNKYYLSEDLDYLINKRTNLEIFT